MKWGEICQLCCHCVLIVLGVQLCKAEIVKFWDFQGFAKMYFYISKASIHLSKLYCSQTVCACFAHIHRKYTKARGKYRRQHICDNNLAVELRWLLRSIGLADLLFLPTLFHLVSTNCYPVINENYFDCDKWYGLKLFICRHLKWNLLMNLTWDS